MEQLNVYVVGDSISIQYGPYLETYLGEAFSYARKTGEEAVLQTHGLPREVNGGDSSSVLAFLQAMTGAGALACDVLLVNCGLHDIKTDPQSGEKQVPIDDYGRNLRTIVELIAPLPMQLVSKNKFKIASEITDKSSDIGKKRERRLAHVREDHRCDENQAGSPTR